MGTQTRTTGVTTIALLVLRTGELKKCSSWMHIFTLYSTPLFQMGRMQTANNKSCPILTLCMLGNFVCLFCRLLFFFKSTFSKNLSGIPSECQTVWNQIRPDILSDLIWVQTVCKGYQQTTIIATSGERIKHGRKPIVYQVFLSVVWRP